MNFSFERLALPEVILVSNQSAEDNRGYFMETYKHSVFKENGIPEFFIQENVSFSKKNVLRGLHFQTGPRAQGKLVRCTKGEILDVAVDVRPDSVSFGRWISQVLSAKEKTQLYIPPGFAHGFLVISEEAEIIYKCTQEYSKDSEVGIIWNDPTININWQISNPILSDKDLNNKKLEEIIHG